MWTKRSKHGRDKIFKTPEALWEAALEYFEHVDSTPFLVEKRTTTDKGVRVEEEYKRRPYTIAAMCIFFGTHEGYWREFRRRAGDDYSPVIMAVDSIIKNNKMEGATSGIFNANIISRELGLADKQEINQNTKIENPYEGLTKEQLIKLAKGK